MRAAALLFAILTACAAHATIPAGRPPASPNEPHDEARTGFVWIDGYWDWRERWIWNAGRWAQERPGYAWSPGMWIVERDRYVWSPGRWTKDERDPCDDY